MRLETLANETLLDESRRILPPAVAASLWAEEVDTGDEADARIREVIGDLATESD
jgi:hypothetical protein